MKPANAFLARRYGARIAAALAIAASAYIAAVAIRGAILCAYTARTCPSPVVTAVWAADDALHAITGYTIVVYTQPEVSINLVRE